MAQLSFLTLNIQGCRDSLKRYSIINFIQKTNKHIMCLQDTHTLKNDESLWRLLWRGPIFFSHLSTRKGGLIIAVLKSLEFKLIKYQEIVRGRILHIEFESDKKIYHVINMYASPDKVERIDNFHTLDKFLCEINKGSIILCGDFNVTLDPSLDRSGDHESHVASQNALQLLILEHSLIDTFRKTNGNEIMFTWSRDNSCSRLDRVYISSHISNRLVYSSVIRCPYSDHDAFCTGFMTSKVKQQSAYWHFNVSLLNDKSYVKIITFFWKKWQLFRSNYDDIRMWWDIGKIKIKDLTQQYSIGLKNKILDNKIYLEEKIKYYENELISN